MDKITIDTGFEGLSAEQLLNLGRNRPAYYYSRKRIDSQIKLFRDTMPKTTKLAYSVKANPFPPLIQFVAGIVDGVDVTSYNEMVACINAGVPPNSIMFAGPAKKLYELRAAVSMGVRISAESISELQRIKEIADILNCTAHTLLRVNPNISIKGASMRMGGTSSQFGIDESDLDEAWRLIDNSRIRFSGIHIYWGSQCLSAFAITEAQQASVDLVEKMSAKFPEEPEKINLGGGFGIPYYERDNLLDISAVAEGFKPLQLRLSSKFPSTQVYLELGRYLVCEAGIYVCQVIDTKKSHGKAYIITDGGLHHFLAATGNFGQKIRRNFHLAMIPTKRIISDETSLFEVEVVGALCTPIDVLGHKLHGPKIEIGDLIVVNCAGAYGRSASPVDFLSHDHPGEFLI
ncbi:MAG: alanine racemase [Alphaproteobacteria bacterium]|nr:alanine racemase [Alphaproteobacteria bacterium]